MCSGFITTLNLKERVLWEDMMIVEIEIGV